MRLKITIVMFLLVISLIPVGTQGAPGDSFVEAVPALPGSNVGSLIQGVSFFYVFTGYGEFQFSLDGVVGTDFDLTIYDETFNAIASATAIAYPDITSVTFYGVIYIEVYAYSGDGSYTLDIIKNSPTGDSFVEAIPAVIGINEGGFVTPQTYSYFFVSTTGYHTFSLIGGPATDFDLYFYDSSENLLSASTNTVYPESIEIYVDEFIYIGVYSFAGIGYFSLNIEPVFPPGTTSDQAFTASLGDNFGILPGTAASQWWIFNGNGDYDVTLNGDAGTDFDIFLYDSGLNYVDSLEVSGYPEIISVSLIGDMYIEIYSFSGSGNYILNLEISTEGSFENPISANYGDNYGSLGETGDQFWFTFNTLGEHTFILSGPDGTDFDLFIYYEGSNVASSGSGLSYEELDYIVNGEIMIEIYAYSGGGDFVLTIFETTNPGETYENPIEVFTGTIFGTLTEEYSNLYYKFYGNGIFTFSLTANADTDFDMSIYDYEGSPIDGAYGTSYPDETTLEIFNYVIIHVYTFSGLGDFELTITAEDVSQPDVYLESLVYSSELTAGDNFLWTGSNSDTGEFSTSLEVLENDLIYHLDLDNDLFEVSDTSEGETDTYSTGFAFPMVMFMETLFSDGSALGFAAGLEYFMGISNENVQITETSSTFEVTIDEGTLHMEITFDKATGVMLEFQLDDEGLSITASLEDSSIDLASSDGNDNDGPGIDLDALPFNFASFFAFLLAIPVIRRLRKN